MEIFENKIQSLFREAFRFNGLLQELSDYQLQKLIDHTDKKLQRLSKDIIEMINKNPKYKYPDDVDQTKLFEYWAERINTGEYFELQKFKASLFYHLRGGEQEAALTEKPKKENSELDTQSLFRMVVAGTIPETDIFHAVKKLSNDFDPILIKMLGKDFNWHLQGYVSYLVDKYQNNVEMKHYLKETRAHEHGNLDFLSAYDKESGLSDAQFKSIIGFIALIKDPKKPENNSQQTTLIKKLNSPTGKRELMHEYRKDMTVKQALEKLNKLSIDHIGKPAWKNVGSYHNSKKN